MTDQERVAIVGGGAIGVTTAYCLSNNGFDVSLFERDEIGSGTGATHRAAGIVHKTHTSKVDARLVSKSLSAFREMRDQLELTQTPYLWFVTDPDQVGVLEDGVRQMRALNIDVDQISGSIVSDQYPAIATDDIEAAAISYSSCCLDPKEYVKYMASRARYSGATIQENRNVNLPDLGDYDEVIVAAGAKTPSLLDAVDVDIPVKPYRVQAMIRDHNPDIPIFFDGTRGYYCRPHRDGMLLGDGTEEIEIDPGDWDPTGDEWFMEEIAEAARFRLQDIGNLTRSWAGLCTATPDGDPLVGQVGDIYVATGWQGHGFMRSPAIGKLLVEILEGKAESPYPPGRFDGDEQFAISEGMGLH
ncbi:MAG: NAD(P)/FAD-dependent oxidoreductase [Halobacteriaceae archaeon]